MTLAIGGVGGGGSAEPPPELGGRGKPDCILMGLCTSSPVKVAACAALMAASGAALTRTLCSSSSRPAATATRL